MRASDAESNVVTMQCGSRECTMLLDSHCRSSIEVANSPCEVTCARRTLSQHPSILHHEILISFFGQKITNDPASLDSIHWVLWYVINLY